MNAEKDALIIIIHGINQKCDNEKELDVTFRLIRK